MSHKPDHPMRPLFPTLDHGAPKLPIPSISIHQTKGLLPLPLVLPLHDVNNLRHDEDMVPDPNQPPDRLIVQQSAPQRVQHPGAPQQRGPAVPSALPRRNHSATLAPAASPLSTWTLNRRLSATASRVRLGVATLKVMRGAGWSVREVNEDMVMPLGTVHQQVRHATEVARPKRPYTFTQVVQLSDGSTYTTRSTSPLPVYRSTKDTRNHLTWQPSESSLKNVEVDEAGKLASFRGRFGVQYDLGEDPAPAPAAAAAKKAAKAGLMASYVREDPNLKGGQVASNRVAKKGKKK
ncbi:hypothetical protein VSDG_07150 [Cytospora chrysosperma]|uniref:Ribosomal protein bL31m N-terminal domain-containing protein n=1 Tax=Cytospora chrysosperma TaxID=252740 RepID=A0A423VKE6_CYTCH|nr:hypothetical protein VSDG_07150 [Valsa sordida]